MKKIFVDWELGGAGNRVTIENDLYHHVIRVLRLAKGESLRVGDAAGNEFSSEIELIEKDRAYLVLLDDGKKIDTGLSRVMLGFPLLKGDRTELVLQKATEIGATSFVLLQCDNSIVKYDDKHLARKMARLERVVSEAAMQSGRELIPQIIGYMSLHKLASMELEPVRVYGDCHGTISVQELKQGKSVDGYCAVVGPEGDFTENEMKLLQEKHFSPVSLSPFILRSETAAISIISQLLI
jgi:16S rRNA (uracil1498-N3)-methyltransferase